MARLSPGAMRASSRASTSFRQIWNRLVISSASSVGSWARTKVTNSATEHPTSGIVMTISRPHGSASLPHNSTTREEATLCTACLTTNRCEMRRGSAVVFVQAMSRRLKRSESNDVPHQFVTLRVILQEGAQIVSAVAEQAEM